MIIPFVFVPQPKSWYIFSYIFIYFSHLPYSRCFYYSYLSTLITYNIQHTYMIRSGAKRLVMLCQQIKYEQSDKKENLIELQQFEGFASVTLNRPKALNSLNLQMIKDFNELLPSISKSKAFWMEGAGGKAFCAGGDVKVLFQKGSVPADRLTFFREEFTLDYKLSQLNTPQIANWDGIVMGGGFGISAFAPFRIATENSMFAMPQAKLGFFTDVGSGYILSRLRNNIGYYLGLTGSRLKGEEVYLSGLANFYIPRQNIKKAFQEIKNELGSSQNAKETIKTILTKYHSPSNKQQIQNQDKIKSLFSQKSLIDIYNRAKNSKDEFQLKMAQLIDQQCPISAGIIYKSITISKNRSIKECFQQDFNICQHLITDKGDFAQGVRTVLVQKGATAKWSHQSISQVTDNQVDKYFQPVSNNETLNI